MQILEHQSLYQKNLISCKLHMPREQIPLMIRHILENISSLGLHPAGRILFTEDIFQYQNIELLVPVEQDFQSCDHYERKLEFKLINAVSVRHEGAFTDIGKTEQKLLGFIREKDYQMITLPYYRIVRLEPECAASCIVDLYIGVNYNVL